MKYFKLPDLGEGLQEAEIVRWHVKAGDTVKTDQLIVSVETAKALVDIPAPFDGVVAKTYGGDGDILYVGEPLMAYEGEGDAGTVVGRLEGGGGSQDDQFFIGAAPSTREHMANRARPIKQDTFDGEKLRGVRRSMALNMARSHAEVVPVTIFADADLHRWGQARDPLIRLGQAMAAACAVEPILNSGFDGQSLSIKQHEKLDLGIAIDTPDGLFVPVLRDVGNRDAADLKEGVNRLRADVQARSIPPKEMMGATMTLSNFGTLFGRYANPVVVPPQVAILAAGGIREEPVAVNGQVVVHPILPLSLTFDHRVVTGGEAARFFKALVVALEEPSRS